MAHVQSWILGLVGSELTTINEIDEALLEARLSGPVLTVGEVGAAGRQSEYDVLPRFPISDVGGADGVGPDGMVVLLGPQLMRSLGEQSGSFLFGTFWSPVYEGWYVDVAYRVDHDEGLTRLLSCGPDQADGASRLAELARQTGHHGTDVDLLTGLPPAVVDELVLGHEAPRPETPQVGNLAPHLRESGAALFISIPSHSDGERLHVCFRQSGTARCIPNDLDYEGTMHVDPTITIEIALLSDPSNDFDDAISRLDAAAVGSIEIIVDESSLSVVSDVDSP